MNNLGNTCGEDLFNVISNLDRVIVDNNAEWKERSLKEPNRAFILGRTISSEAHNLEGVFFNEKVKGGRKNVFLFGVAGLNRHTVIEIQRIDIHLKAIFRRPLPTLDETTPAERAQWNDPQKRLQQRDRIEKIVGDFSSESLRQKIKATAPLAFKNYETSWIVAEWAYALLLQETGHKDKREREKFTNNHENLFGDTQMIQEALFFNARILSGNTQHVWRMASYCEIRCEKEN